MFDVTPLIMGLELGPLFTGALDHLQSILQCGAMLLSQTCAVVNPCLVGNRQLSILSFLRAGTPTDLTLQPFGTHPKDGALSEFAKLICDKRVPHGLRCSEWNSTNHILLRHTHFYDPDPDYQDEGETPEILCPYADIRLILDDAYVFGREKQFLLLVKCEEGDSAEASQLAAVKMRLEAVRGALERYLSSLLDVS